MQAVAGDLHADQARPLHREHFLHLPRAFLVHARRDADDGDIRAHIGEGPAFHQPRAVDGAQDGHADRGKGFRHGAFLTAADARTHARDDRASIDRDAGIARIDGFVTAGRGAVQHHHLDAFLAQRGHEGIVLRLLFRERRDHLAAPIGAGRRIAVGSEFGNERQAIEKLHFLARAVHQHGAQAADVGIAAPAPAPARDLLAFAVEGRLGLGGEALDQHVVAVIVLAHCLGHGVSLPRCAGARRGRRAAAAA